MPASLPPDSSPPNFQRETPFPPETVKGLPGWLILLGALNAIGPLSIDMYLPGLPAIANDLHTHAGAMQRTLALFFIGLSLGQLFYGPSSDRFGRKPPLYVGLTLYAVASIGCALAADVHALTFWRFVQGLGGCAGIVIPRAVVRDRCDALGMARALSMLMLVMGLAPILAPLLGNAVMALFSWRVIFIFQAFFGLSCLLLVIFGMRETHDSRNAAPLRLGYVLRNYGGLFKEGRFLRPALAGVLAQGGLFAYVVGSPFVLIEIYGIPATMFGWVFGVNAVGLIAGSQVNARLVRRLPLPVIMRRALWTVAITTVLSIVAQLLGLLSLPAILLCLLICVTSLSFISPNTSALALQHQAHRAGTASALLGSMQFGMGAIAGLAMSLWHRADALPLLSVIAACGVGALLVAGVRGATPPLKPSAGL